MAISIAALLPADKVWCKDNKLMELRHMDISPMRLRRKGELGNCYSVPRLEKVRPFDP
ncbi:hypothetical protein YC2023_061890 [Brassica napus]